MYFEHMDDMQQPTSAFSDPQRFASGWSVLSTGNEKWVSTYSQMTQLPCARQEECDDLCYAEPYHTVREFVPSEMLRNLPRNLTRRWVHHFAYSQLLPYLKPFFL